jgi:uncharacterized protein YbbK (DUF523 family)
MSPPNEIILVSACLLGVNCRYNGASKKDERVIEWLRGRRFVPVCPESLSGLPAPRDPADFDDGDGAGVLSGRCRIISRGGQDWTKEFLRGATEAARIAGLVGATRAVLKERSPSCGVHQVYVRGRLTPGKGLLAAMLEQEGIKTVSESELFGS